MATSAIESHVTRSLPVLELRDGAVLLGTQRRIEHLNLSLAQGERLALLGPSGVGKTTVLRAIAGLDALASGELLINGDRKTESRPEQRRVVYLHQTPSLFPHLSVRDNVAFPLILRGTSRSNAREIATALLDTMHLLPLANRMPEKLSGGERHRTALARALAADPLVLLLDEPFSALDPGLRHEIRAEVLSMLSRTGSPAAIVVTHDVDEATLFGERIAILLSGGIQQCDVAQTVVRAPSTIEVAQFLGVPNIVPGACEKRNDLHAQWTSLVGACESPAHTASSKMFAVGWADMLTVLPAGGDGAPGIVMGVEHRGFGRVVRVQLDGMVVVGFAAPDATWVAGDAVAVALATTHPHLLPAPGSRAAHAASPFTTA